MAMIAQRVMEDPTNVRIDRDLNSRFLKRILNGRPIESLHVHARFLAMISLPNLRVLSLHGERPLGFRWFPPLEGLRVLVLTGIRHIEDYELVHLIKRLESNCPHFEELYVRGPLSARVQQAWRDF